MRTVIAGVLTAAALVALLLGWFGSGWSGMRAEQAALRARPRAEAEATARALAADLSARLEELRRAESERPYYHYGNLFHDPRGASQGLSVAPSPLATGPTDALVRGHFQIDAGGAVTVPTINDAAPELTDAARADVDRALRTQVAALEPALVVAPDRKASSGGPLVAVNDAPPPAPEYVWVDEPDAPVGKTSSSSSSSSKPVGVKSKKYVSESKTVDVPVATYAQNAAAQQVYSQVNAPPEQAQQPAAAGNGPGPVPQMAAPVRQPARPAPQPAAPAPHHHRRRVLVHRPAPPAPPRTVQVTIAPLEWRATTIDGGPALAAVRRVDTPDGSMTQGLVVTAGAASDWLASREGGGGARVISAPRAADGGATAPVGVPGWLVAIDASPAIAAADADADALSSAFLGRFVPVALLALLCGALVVLVVARAEKLARERARFAAAAAHELRTPLAGLQLYGDMLADGLGDQGKARDYARRMSEEASRLGRVVSNVLGFSQLERGNLSLHPAVGDVAAAVRASCERARPALERAGVALDVEIADGDAVTARFDGDALARVVGNLLDNAEKYGRDGANRRIRVALAQAGEQVEVQVLDRGPGVPPRALGRLFRPFVRAAGADGPPGLGLGLALSRSMAQGMGGDLVHRETAGGGATFVIVLPAT